MPRRPRVAPGGHVYHVLNRGNCRMNIFSKPADYLAFIKLLDEARQRTAVRILAFCLMPNHWHLVLHPRNTGDLTRFVRWISTTHVRRWRAHRRSAGEGHLYQGRYKSFIVAADQHLRTVLRYVEQNPLRATLAESAEQWPWSSAAAVPPLACDDWPVPRPRDWAQRLNEDLPQATLQRLRQSLSRNRPFGDERWVQRTAARLGLQHTLRDPWRPRRKPKPRQAEK